MRITIGILSLLYGTVGVLPIVMASCSWLLSFAASSELTTGNVGRLAIGALAGGGSSLAMLGMCIGGVGILCRRHWGILLSGISALVIIIGVFGFSWLISIGEATAPGASVPKVMLLATFRALAVAAVPMLVFWWCRRPSAMSSFHPSGPSATELLAKAKRTSSGRESEELI